MLIVMQQLAILDSKMERLQGEAESQRKQFTFRHACQNRGGRDGLVF
jgi:hypothetical protein